MPNTQDILGWFKKQSITLLCCATILLMCWIQITSNPAEDRFIQRLDYLLYDLRMRTMLPYQQVSASQHKVVIIDVDEKSLKKVGRWPWSRRVMKSLIANLEGAGVTAIGFDIVFAEPELNPALTIASSIDDPSLKQSLMGISDQFNFDQQFADQMSNSNTDVVAGFFLLHENITNGNLPTPQKLLDEDVIKHTVIPDMSGYAANISNIQQSAYSSGFLSVSPDPDGIIRRVSLLLKYKNHLYPSLGLELAKTYRLAEKYEIQTYRDGDVEKVSQIKLDNLILPTDAAAKMLIPYRGKQGFYSYVSASDVVENTFDRKLLNSSVVLVGSSAIGLADLKPSPLSPSFPGLEIQATIADGILRGNLPSSPDWGLGVTLVQLVGIGLILIFIFPRVGPLTSGVISLSFLLGSIAFNFYFWHKYQLDLSLASLLVEIIIIVTLYTIYGFYKETAQRVRIKSMFGQYVAPGHIDNLLSSEGNLSFDGETKEMTVLFADIRSFTNISEKLTAGELKQLLNRFFTPMTGIIFSQQGCIDKYVGDMIMAFWGAPLNDPEQCQHAVTAAMQMLEKVEQLKPEFAAAGLPEVNIGVGLNTGMMNVGDMGSTYRRAYTVLGDSVNLGSRLESITKFYDAKCLVSETTYAKTSGILYRLVDFIKVKGKEEPVKVYEPVCFEAQASDETKAVLQKYAEARELYLAKDWQAALNAYQQLVIDNPKREYLYAIYIERINEFLATPPEDDWIGVFKHTSK